MCLAVPGEIQEIEGNRAVVDFGGAERDIKLDLLEDASEGDYVLVHVGYAIQVISQSEAEKMLESWKEVTEERTKAKT